MFFEFDGILNVRDLGGHVREDGRAIKPMTLFRGGELCDATDEDIRRFAEELKIKALIDLRGPSETKLHPDRDVPGCRYYNLPATPSVVSNDKNEIIAEILEGPIEAFKKTYYQLAISPGPESALRGFFKILLEDKPETVFWHCAQGKDRTGIVAIMLMVALGFSEEAAVDEYMLTNPAMTLTMQKIRERGISPEKERIMNAIYFVHRECVNVYVDTLDKRCGSLDNYLTECIGLTDAQKRMLQDAYME